MPVKLNSQFKYALDLFENSNKHIFLTGKAGTGKSTLLRIFRQGTKKNHVVLAPTGVAAVNVRGQTIHSFFKFSPSITKLEAQHLGENAVNNKLYKKLELIIIDEISMVRADLFDQIDIFLKAARKNNEPFGGVQTIVIGDLFQLSPVLTKNESETFYQQYNSPFFFDSEVFKRIQPHPDFFEILELDQVYRQTDQSFITILNNIRSGEISISDLKKINAQIANLDYADQYTNYIHLVATNQQAKEINQLNLDKLKTKTEMFDALVEGDFENKSFPTDSTLQLKVGSRVMFCNNDQHDRWINGTLGEVTYITTSENSDEPIVEVRLDNKKLVEVIAHTWGTYKTVLNEETNQLDSQLIGSFTQLPLKLAWAITIHKSQGKTFKKVVIDLGWGAFAAGQVYVALSRCTSLEGITLKKPILQKHIIRDPNVLKFYQLDQSSTQLLPSSPSRN